jgi:lysine 2,3-aminomutase
MDSDRRLSFRDVREAAAKEDWKDWRWQLRNRITTLEELEQFLTLHPDETAGVKMSRGKFAMSITPYWLSLMDREDPRCPIRRQVVPHIKETYTAKYELVDPCGEEKDMPVPGLVHRYPDRVLFIVTDKCASYCRFCTRKRIVSDCEEISINVEKRVDQAVLYIKKNKQIRDVLISGGDPLLLSDNKLDYILGALRELPQIEILRIGTRVPITLPQRITDSLLKTLVKYHPLWMSLHVNHPLELTADAREACGKLADKGIPLGSQTVLLRGINDSVEVMKRLVQVLLMARVRPYYLYQCDPVMGTEHFRTTVSRGVEIMKGLRGWTTGYAVPTFVIDAPGGGGKVPVSYDYVLKSEKMSSEGQKKITVSNFMGNKFEYIEPSVEIYDKKTPSVKKNGILTPSDIE